MKYYITAFALSITACAGGETSPDPISDPPPASTPPPSSAPPTAQSNTAPTLSVSASATQLDERQPFVIDASASTDPDGDELTFELDLGDLPHTKVDTPNAPSQWDISTAEVDETKAYTLTASVSDGVETVSQSIEITLQNYDRTPLNSTWTEASEVFEISKTGSARFADNTTESGFSMAHVLRETSNGKMEILEFEMTNGFGAPDSVVLDIPMPSDAILQTVNFKPGDPFRSFSITSDQDDQVWIFKRNDRSEAMLTGSLNLPGLCSTSWATITLSSNGGVTPSLYTGMDRGLSLFVNEGALDRTSTQYGTFLDSMVYQGRVFGNYCAAGPFSTFYDSDRTDFFALRDTNFGAPNFPAVTSVNVPNSLDLVTFKAGKLKHQIKFYALLFAGPEHTSPHQLTILHKTPSGNIEQLDYALPSGIPTDLIVQSIDTNFVELTYDGTEGNRDTDIVIAVPETPYVYIITVEPDDLGGVTFGPLEFFEAGFDVKDIHVEVTDGTYRYSLITNDGYTLRLHESALDFRRF